MRKHVKEIGKFFVFVAIFFALTSPFVVLFGPFDNLKRTVIGAILKSRHPQYITWLFSQEEIDEILGGISSTPKQELFKFKARTDSTLTLKNIDSSRFKGFLLEIPDPHRVQVATAENMDEKGDTTSGIAERVGAVAAINAGGFYDANGTGTGRQPYGFILHDGKYLLGQDASDEEENEFVGFTKDGNLIVGNYSKAELKEKDVVEGISFGPALIVNGEKMITHGKTKAAERNIPLPVCLAECLKAAKETSTSEYVVSNRDGEPLSYTQFKRLWQYIVTRTVKERSYYRYEDGKRVKHTVTPVLGEKAAHNGKVVYSLDFEVTPHQLRHTYITNLIHASVDPKTVQYLAGHESSKITMDIYAKVKYNRPDELVRSMNCAFASWDATQ